MVVQSYERNTCSFHLCMGSSSSASWFSLSFSLCPFLPPPPLQVKPVSAFWPQCGKGACRDSSLPPPPPQDTSMCILNTFLIPDRWRGGGGDCYLRDWITRSFQAVLTTPVISVRHLKNNSVYDSFLFFSGYSHFGLIFSPSYLICVEECWDRTCFNFCIEKWDALTTRLDLIHNSASLVHHSARSHPQLCYISSTTLLGLIHHSARSHPPLC